MDFLQLLRRFIPPYRIHLALNIIFNLLSTILSLFSFAAIIPVLQILFGLAAADTEYITITSAMSFNELFDAIKNNVFYWLQSQIEVHGSGYVLFLLGAFLVTMTALKCACAYFASYHMIPIRTGVLRDLRQSLYNKIVSLPIGFFTQERKGDIMSRMTNDVVEVEVSIMAMLEMIFKDPVMILIYLITLFSLSWQLTLFVLFLLPTAGWFIGWVGRSLKRRSTKGQEQTADLLTQIEETLGGLRIVKAFNAEHKLRERFYILNNKTRRTFIALERKYQLAHPMSEFLGTTLIAVLLWYGGGLILADHSTIDAATFIYYLVIFYSIINPAKDLTKAVYSIRKGMASLERIDRILATESSIVEKELPLPIKEFKDKIEYRNVSFHYQEDRPVLQNINLTIPKGQTVALVGQSGSGKTTMADLLPRFYDVIKGAIQIDGVDIRDVSTRDLRAIMGNVNQEAILFNDTFYNNITFGVDTTKPAPNGQTWEEAVIAAAKIANAHDFIISTPEGYQTNIGDRGSRLSGGQRQRISIARAILKNPPILILDEATSALDTESEKLVQEALEHLMRDRTTLVVAHRLSTIRNADLICVLHEGQIVEQGKHDDLLAKNGYYHKLIEMQNGK
ncbi:MAG: ABC transporter ATP-binding protein/permease [Paludibacteraceae bacterium]|nr:ABC transporter ATP-binding protein/permease [Paludibacteraceae bacterium]